MKKKNIFLPRRYEKIRDIIKKQLNKYKKNF